MTAAEVAQRTTRKRVAHQQARTLRTFGGHCGRHGSRDTRFSQRHTVVAHPGAIGVVQLGVAPPRWLLCARPRAWSDFAGLMSGDSRA